MNVTLSRRDTTFFRNHRDSAQIRAQSVFVVIGPAGSGKSTLVRHLQMIHDSENANPRLNDVNIYVEASSVDDISAAIDLRTCTAVFLIGSEADTHVVAMRNHPRLRECKRVYCAHSPAPKVLWGRKRSEKI